MKQIGKHKMHWIEILASKKKSESKFNIHLNFVFFQPILGAKFLPSTPTRLRWWHCGQSV